MPESIRDRMEIRVTSKQALITIEHFVVEFYESNIMSMDSVR